MAAGKYDFNIEQGTTFVQDFVWKDSNNAAINITGYTARMQVRQTTASATVLLECTTENGKLALGGTNGTITLGLTATETAAFTFTSGVYDLELVSGAGAVTRLLKGTITIDPEVTR